MAAGRNVGGSLSLVTLLNTAHTAVTVLLPPTEKRRRRRLRHTPSTHGAHAPSHTQFSRSLLLVGFYSNSAHKRPLHTQVVDSFRLLQTSSSFSPPHLFLLLFFFCLSRWVFQSFVYSHSKKKNSFNYSSLTLFIDVSVRAVSYRVVNHHDALQLSQRECTITAFSIIF